MAVEILSWKKSQTILVYRYMIYNCSCCSHTQGVRVSNIFKPSAIFCIDGLDRKEIIVE